MAHLLAWEGGSHAEEVLEFQRTFGRPPTAVEALWQADQATLETRAPKHQPRSERDQRAPWRAEADDVMGNPAEVDEMYARAIGRRPRAGRRDTGITAGSTGGRKAW